MSAAAVLSRLRMEGFAVIAADQKVLVRPSSALTDEHRALIRLHRAELLRLLLDPDPRVTCTACKHYSAAAHRCGNYVAALLQAPDIAPALAALPQHCPAWAPIKCKLPHR